MKYVSPWPIPCFMACCEHSRIVLVRRWSTIVYIALCSKHGLRKCIGLPFLTSSYYYSNCSRSYFNILQKICFKYHMLKQFLPRLILFLTKIKAQGWISLSPTPPFVSLIIFTGHLRWSTYLRISTECKIKCSWPLPRDAIVLLLFSHIFLYCLFHYTLFHYEFSSQNITDA